MKITLLAIFLILLTSTELLASDDFTPPTTYQLGDSELILNGFGYRKATIFKVKVYLAALYLTEKMNSPELVLGSHSPKVVSMKFVRDVSNEKLREGWEKGINSNFAAAKDIATEFQHFQSLMRDIKDGEVLKFEFLNNSVTVYINDTKIGEVDSQTFQTALLSVWLGKNPPNESLKQELLGN